MDKDKTDCNDMPMMTDEEISEFIAEYGHPEDTFRYLTPHPAPVTASPGWQPIETISRAAQDVLAERQRQISVEGWDDTHDDCNDKSELAQAAACYALSGTPADEAVFIHGRWKDPRDLFWPWTWDRSWWKPTNRRRDLVKAGALILAEIERLDRAAPEAEGGSDER